MLMKKLKSHNFSYNTYFIAGTENIQPFLMQGKETKEETLIRIVKSFAQNGLDVFQLRCKKMQESETYKLIYEISRVLENTKCKYMYEIYLKIIYLQKTYLQISIF